jgi:hypothetical protein
MSTTQQKYILWLLQVIILMFHQCKTLKFFVALISITYLRLSFNKDLSVKAFIVFNVELFSKIFFLNILNSWMRPGNVYLYKMRIRINKYYCVIRVCAVGFNAYTKIHRRFLKQIIADMEPMPQRRQRSHASDQQMSFYYKIALPVLHLVTKSCGVVSKQYLQLF